VSLCYHSTSAPNDGREPRDSGADRRLARRSGTAILLYTRYQMCDASVIELRAHYCATGRKLVCSGQESVIDAEAPSRLSFRRSLHGAHLAPPNSASVPTANSYMMNPLVGNATPCCDLSAFRLSSSSLRKLSKCLSGRRFATQGPEGDEARVKRYRIETVSSLGVHFNVDRLQLGTSLLASLLA
jgi:hypothetical protein